MVSKSVRTVFSAGGLCERLGIYIVLHEKKGNVPTFVRFGLGKMNLSGTEKKETVEPSLFIHTQSPTSLQKGTENKMSRVSQTLRGQSLTSVPSTLYR